jgi:phosphopantetheinyl transferase
MLPPECWTRYATFDRLWGECDWSSVLWLSHAEREELSRLRDESRRTAWLAARWVAKMLVRDTLAPGAAMSRVEILSRRPDGKAMRPALNGPGHAGGANLSIAHSDRAVLVGLSAEPTVRVGVDLAEPEALDPRSLVFWFSERERRLIRGGDRWQAASCWALKEATYKACHRGESFVPRRSEAVALSGGGWSCHYDGRPPAFIHHLRVWVHDGHAAAAVLASDRRRTFPPRRLAAVPLKINGRAEVRPESRAEVRPEPVESERIHQTADAMP